MGVRDPNIIYAVNELERLLDSDTLTRDELVKRMRVVMYKLRSEMRRNGVKVPSRKNNRTDKAEIIKMARGGMTAAEIGRKVGLTRQRISFILSETLKG